MRIIKIVIFLFVPYSILFSQTKSKKDSLKSYTFSELKNKFYAYDDKSDTLNSKIIAEYYLKKAKKEKNNLEMANGYILAHFNKNLHYALKCLDSAYLVSKNLKGTIYPSQTYLMRGNLYYKNDKLKIALDNYILGLKYAKESKNQLLTTYADIDIAYLNSYIGKNTEAAKTFRHYLYEQNNNAIDSYQHNQLRGNLINCYIELNKLDSAKILINEGRTSIFANNNEYSTNLYNYYSGCYNLKLKKYKTAINELTLSYKYFSSNNDNNLNYVVYNLGKAYQGVKNNEKTVQYFSKLDSNVQKTNITFPELREVYSYLVGYYKEKKDKQKQLYYIDRFLQVDGKLDEQFKYLSIELPKKYEMPMLLEQKESIISNLKDRKIKLYISVGILLLILVLLVYLYSSSIKKEKKYKKIAQDLIKSINEEKISDLDEKENREPIAKNNNQPLEKVNVKVISEDVVQNILQELEKFEINKLFLKKGITLNSLSKNFKTNSTYLSDIINTYKKKNFSTYLNDLRIDYAINRLAKDKKFCMYKISSIADELGYNNEQAFTLAFKKRTGTLLSVYLKEVEKTHLERN